MSASSVEATRELCDDLDSFIETAKQSHAPIRAVCLIELNEPAGIYTFTLRKLLRLR